MLFNDKRPKTTETGQVAEEGTHDELVSAKDGVYAGLVKRQLDISDHHNNGAEGGKASQRAQGAGDTSPEVVRSKKRG